MAKKQGHEKGAGPYSQNDVTFRRPKNIDESGNVTTAPKRDLSKVVDAAASISGMGLTRVIHKAPAKRYGP